MMGWCPNDGEECRHDGWCNDCEHADAKIRYVAVKARESLIAELVEILADIRASNVDESVCGMCEYDGAYMGASGDWCNECPGFDKDDCFKLSDKVRKRWLGLTKEG